MSEKIEYVEESDLLYFLWEKLWLLAAVAVISGLFMYGISYLIEPRYRSTVSLIVVDPQDYGQLSGLFSRASGIASLIGIESGAGSTAEAVEFLKSRFLRSEFIKRNNLIPVLYPDQFDKEAGRWIEPEEQPTEYAAVERFGDQVLIVSKDPKTGLIEVSFEWGDPATAVGWANDYIQLADDLLRERAMSEARASLKYLTQEFEQTGVVTVRQAISNAVEQQVGRMAVLQARLAYAYRVIDPAVKADDEAYIWPRHLLLGIAGMTLGGLLAIFISVYLRFGRRKA